MNVSRRLRFTVWWADLKRTWIYPVLKRIPGLGFCPMCGRCFQKIERRRLCTAYVDDERNYVKTCEDCFVETNDYYHGLWMEYYNGCM